MILSSENGISIIEKFYGGQPFLFHIVSIAYCQYIKWQYHKILPRSNKSSKHCELKLIIWKCISHKLYSTSMLVSINLSIYDTIQFSNKFSWMKIFSLINDSVFYNSFLDPHLCDPLSSNFWSTFCFWSTLFDPHFIFNTSVFNSYFISDPIIIICSIHFFYHVHLLMSIKVSIIREVHVISICALNSLKMIIFNRKSWLEWLNNL